MRKSLEWKIEHTRAWLIENDRAQEYNDYQIVFRPMSSPRVITEVSAKKTLKFVFSEDYAPVLTLREMKSMCRQAMKRLKGETTNLYSGQDVYRVAYRKDFERGRKKAFERSHGLMVADVNTQAVRDRFTEYEDKLKTRKPRIYDYYKSITVELRPTPHDLSKSPIADIDGMYERIFVDPSICDLSVDEGGYVLFHEACVVKTWDKRKDKCDRERLERYLKGYRGRENIEKSIKERGWHFQEDIE